MVQNTTLLTHIAIVLVRPKIPENIGAAARIAWNMGINRLIVVRDSLPDREAMAKMATHKAAHLIDTLEIYPNLPEALARFHGGCRDNSKKRPPEVRHPDPPGNGRCPAAAIDQQSGSHHLWP